MLRNIKVQGCRRPDLVQLIVGELEQRYGRNVVQTLGLFSAIGSCFGQYVLNQFLLGGKKNP
jgi:hypothetical protein